MNEGRCDPSLFLPLRCTENRFDELSLQQRFHGVLGSSWKTAENQILCYENYIENYPFHARDRRFFNGGAQTPVENWHQHESQDSISFSTHASVRRNFLPFFTSLKKKKKSEKLSLWLHPVLNISLCDENTNTYSWQKSFYLIIQSMFYKKLLLFLSYAWIMFVFRSEIFYERK